jgi:organic radical activating enzyme
MEQYKAPVVEIFKSLEGEGYFIGTPTIFVRLAGCDVGCVTCDSRQTWSMLGFPEMTVKQVMEKIDQLSLSGSFVSRVSITGGEPLLHEAFLRALCDQFLSGGKYTSNLETSGTRFPSYIFGKFGCIDCFNTVSLDIKTPSSGVVLDAKQIAGLITACQSTEVYTKAVIATPEDIEFVLCVFKGVDINNLVLTPCELDGNFSSLDMIYQTLDKYRVDVGSMGLRIIAQQHKLLGYR